MTAAALDVPSIRERLRGVAEKIRADIAGREAVDARVREWAAMPIEYRMALLLLAGVDGDLQALGRKAWSEFTEPEKLAVQVALRGMARAIEKSYALKMRAV